jgi:hypothetical protein
MERLRSLKRQEVASVEEARRPGILPGIAAAEHYV